jgi:hypothetical protein
MKTKQFCLKFKYIKIITYWKICVSRFRISPPELIKETGFFYVTITTLLTGLNLSAEP